MGRGTNQRVRAIGSKLESIAGRGLSARATALLAAALFVVVFVLRQTSNVDSAGYALFYSLPIAILALRFGVRGGLAGAVVAELLFIISASTVVSYPGALPYISRATAFLTLGVLVGYLSQRLAANEARFEVALRSAPILVFSLDRDLRYTWVHHTWDGRIDVEMVGKTDLELLPAGEGQIVYDLKRKVLDTGEPAGQEILLHDPQGRPRWFRTTVEPIREASGRIVGLTGASFDITELKTALDEVAASEERFRGAVESLLEPMAIYSAVRDESGAITDFRCDYINGVGAETVGMRPEAMRGELLSELFPGRLELGLLDRYTKVVDTGEPHMRDEVDYVNVFGEEQMVRAFDMVIAKFGDGVQVIWRDITDRKRAEIERDRLAAIVDASIDAIMSADLDGTIKTWSAGAERLYGWKAAEIVGSVFLPRLVPPELHAIRGQVFARVAGGEAVGPIASRELRKDGTSMRVSFTATPIHDADGEIVGVARIVRPVDRPDAYFTIDEEAAAEGDVPTSGEALS